MTDAEGTPALLVQAAGVRTLIEDLGRPGQARLGVTGSGAWDRGAHTLAQRLVGNPEDAAGLEILLGGVRLLATRRVTVALTGADASLTIDGQSVPTHTPLTLASGNVLALGQPRSGLRSYLAIRGGLAGRRAFGSLSGGPVDGIGPGPVRVGDLLAVGPEPEGLPVAVDVAAAAARSPGEVLLKALVGPRDDWFTAEALEILSGATWRVAPETDRVGTRLLGPELPRARAGELASEGLVRGAIQVPASGLPLVFGPDHPTTGGYPVIACVSGQDADALAQAAPDTVVRFELRRHSGWPAPGR